MTMTDIHCFPHSGGFSQQFRALSAALAPLTPRPVDYPRPPSTPGPPESVRGFATAWLDRHGAHSLDGSYLYGHSLGGMVAFEAALQLERRGGTAAGVVIAGAVASSHTPVSGIDPEHCSDTELMDWSFDTIHGRAPAPGEAEVFHAFAPRLRRDLGMYRRYRPGGSLRGTRVLLLTGSRDRVCPPSAEHYWADRVGDLTTREIGGGHLFHLESPREVGEAIADWTKN